MKRKLKVLTLFVASLVILLFVITMINQIAIFSGYVGGFNEAAGQATRIVLSVLLLLVLVLPLWFYLRLPAQLSWPADGNPQAEKEYRKKLAEQLNRNRYVRAENLTVDETNIDDALNILDAEAHKELKQSASVIFVSTAVSQSGKLDAFIVFALLVKMVWRIAHIYNQRPSYSGLVSLYANVTGTTLIAGSVDEIDISEQLEPVLGELIGASAFGAIPGLSQISAFTFSCLMEGSVNAFLALRMGEITIGYSRSTAKPDRKTLRKSASRKAVGRLRVIIREFGSEVVVSIKNVGVSRSKKMLDWKGWFGKSEKRGPENLSAEEYLGIDADKTKS